MHKPPIGFLACIILQAKGLGEADRLLLTDGVELGWVLRKQFIELAPLRFMVTDPTFQRCPSRNVGKTLDGVAGYWNGVGRVSRFGSRNS